VSPELAPDLEDDAVLVRLARDGSARAIDALVRRHHAAVFRLCLGVLGDEDGAADATQETFVKAVRGLARFRGDAAFRTWLLSIALNEARGALRRDRRRRETGIDGVGPLADRDDPAGRAALRDAARRVRERVAELPEKQRLAVTLRIDEGLSFREIGEIIGSSEGAARVNYHHGIRRLREQLEESDE